MAAVVAELLSLLLIWGFYQFLPLITSQSFLPLSRSLLPCFVWSVSGSRVPTFLFYFIFFISFYREWEGLQGGG